MSLQHAEDGYFWCPECCLPRPGDLILIKPNWPSILRSGCWYTYIEKWICVYTFSPRYWRNWSGKHLFSYQSMYSLLEKPHGKHCCAVFQLPGFTKAHLSTSNMFCFRHTSVHLISSAFPTVCWGANRFVCQKKKKRFLSWLNWIKLAFPCYRIS